MSRLQGIDISEAQGEINWEELGASEHLPAFIYAKATEGKTIQDARYKEYHAGAKSQNIPWGAYHFLHMKSSSAIDQARNFINTISGMEGQLLPMVDVEAASQDGVTDVGLMVHQLATFLQEVEKTLKGKRMLIYSGYSWWQDVLNGTDAFSGHLFWEAQYSNQEDPDVPHGFKKVSVWQKTDHLLVPGISSGVDGDYLLEPDLSIISR